MRGAKVFRSFFCEPLQGSRFLLQAEPALKCNFASKLVEVRGYSLFCDEKRIPSITPKRKGRFLSVVHSYFVYNKVKVYFKELKFFRSFF